MLPPPQTPQINTAHHLDGSKSSIFMDNKTRMQKPQTALTPHIQQGFIPYKNNSKKPKELPNKSVREFLNDSDTYRNTEDFLLGSKSTKNISGLDSKESLMSCRTTAMSKHQVMIPR